MLDIDTYTQEEEDKEGETGRVRRRRCREIGQSKTKKRTMEDFGVFPLI